ncbi:hypothetical protein HFO09_09015 [Rhizobium laguerreae]|uniref:cadherin domain-containing protein n=1 Tax=Rhizobium laguerreae TaxID=1076926 RepID=UPI001C91EA46|nr:cadherin domain-containing protein [Rhizobium laguerreae]MBY3259867.1 hypothetical protein [Rhizobium laguerreae]MBY3282862.1 hypothetical protein [Rhizobium laguerreae]MBY3289216.1 hypothetical protein [Rhizobium laguerreae]
MPAINQSPSEDDGATLAIAQVGIIVNGTDDPQTLEGTPGDDEIYGFGGDDVILGHEGDDWLVGGAGNDEIDGGAGTDSVAYTSAGENGGQGVVVNLSGSQYGAQAAHTATDTFGGTDTLISIEEARGTSENDVFVSDPGSDYNSFWGLAGSDTIEGAGRNTWIRYDRDGASGGMGGVTVNLSDDQHGTQGARSATDGFGDTDTLLNVDNVRGTDHDDVFYGNSNDNRFQMLGGNDYVDGGAGDDEVNYSGDNRSGAPLHGVFVNLSGQAQSSFLGTVAAHSAIGLFNDVDTLISIEEALGSELADVLIGDPVPGKYQGFHGLAGNDTIVGGGDNSWVYYDQDARFGGNAGVIVNLSDTTQGTQSAHTATDGFGDTDTLTNVERVRGTAAADVIYGDQSRNMFELGAGDDYADGGEGDDAVNYAYDDDGTAMHGVFVNLTDATSTSALGTAAAHTAIGLYGDIDTLVSIEDVQGSSYDDVLIAEAAPEKYQGLSGYAGNDTLVGGGENSWVYYSEDALFGGTAGVTVNLSDAVRGTLAAHTATDGFGDTDSLSNIGNVRATASNDVIYGDDADNQFELGAGDDVVDGGEGSDTVNYRFNDDGTATHGALVNLSGQTFTTPLGTVGPRSALDLYGDIDTFVSIENVTGSGLSDYIIGNGQANRLIGGDGDDTLLGGGEDDLLMGGRGSDHMDGGGGLDTVDYSHEVDDGATGGVTVNLLGDAARPELGLEADTARDSFGSIDVVTNIRNVTGTQFADVIYGGNHANTLIAGDGDDILLGGGDDDTLDGDNGSDTAKYAGNRADYLITDNGDGSLTVADLRGGAPDGTDVVRDIELLQFADRIVGGAANSAPAIDGGDAVALDVGENQTAVATITASDPDAGDALAFSINGGSDAAKFEIDAATGDLRFVSAPDFETPADSDGDNVYEVTVQVSDGLGGADTQSIAVTITDVDESGPIFTSGTSAVVAENSVGVAYDADAQDASAITFALSGADSSAFDIDSATGAVSFKAAPNYEAASDSNADNVYDIVVTASDGANSTDRAVAITVSNVNDNAPVFSSPGTASFAENAAGAVYDANATDADDLGALTFSLSGADAALFSIDGASGVIGFLVSPNFEAPNDAGGDNVYDIVVTASDGTLATPQVVAITVTDVAEGGTVINGTGAANTLNGTPGEDTINGLGGNDTLNGLGGNDHLNGGNGSDFLNGGQGSDAMQGGAGADTYVVDDAGDVVDESAPGSTGRDLVQSAIAFSLVASATVLGDVEDLTLTGSSNTDGTGNALNNELTGNDGDNLLQGGQGNDTLVGNGGNDTLDGGLGNDTMRGGAGDDTYLVESLTDRIDEAGAGGVDTIKSSIAFSLLSGRVTGSVENLTLSGGADINATGNELDNVLVGNSGNNLLDGRAGADTMQGEGGNDTYVVDNVNDIVDEDTAGAGGIDTVRTSFTFSLSDATQVLGQVENLILTGNDDVDGIGNDADNAITGNNGINVLTGGGGSDLLVGNRGGDTLLGGAGNDDLDGGAGADRLDGGAEADIMAGGAGGDTYVVDNTGDSVQENANEGRDTVETSLAAFVLSDNVENLVYTGGGNFTGTGNALNNTISGGGGSDDLNGGGGNDVIVGGVGNDFFTGGAGADQFHFNAPLSTAGVDTITDFVSRSANPGVRDRIVLSNSAEMFSQLQDGTLSNAAFAVANGGQAQDSSDRIVYDPTTGWLTYDENGSAAGGSPIHFATLQPGLTLQGADFLVV